MKSPFRRQLRRLFFVSAVFSLCLSARGQPNIGLATNVPPLPVFQPRTELFRRVLAMSASAQEQWLTNRPVQLRSQLEAKIKEYQAMTPEAREEQLRATELHEYMQYFIRTPAVDRASQVAQIPVEYRKTVTERLRLFDILPPELQKEVLTGKTTADYFLNPTPPLAKATKAVYPPPPMPPEPLMDLSRLTPGQRQQMFASFQHFFDLDDDARQKTLATLPPVERAQVEKTLQSLESLPKEQRERGLQSISTLAGMTDEQRAAFFQSAVTWRELPPGERQTWHKLVEHLPPLPPPFPPLPTSPVAPGGLSAETNPSN